MTHTAVISFVVSVPVLSEQMTVTEPRVSTAGRRRTMACWRAMTRVPMARTMVNDRQQSFGGRCHRHAGGLSGAVRGVGINHLKGNAPDCQDASALKLKSVCEFPPEIRLPSTRV
jgi:hypothetical protein